MNLVVISDLGVALRSDAIEGIRFNVKKNTKYFLAEDRVPQINMISETTTAITATIRFNAALFPFVVPDYLDEMGENDPSSAAEVELSVVTSDSPEMSYTPFFTSSKYSEILANLENTVATLTEEFESATKKNKEAAEANLEKAKKNLNSATKAPVSFANNISAIETATTQKSMYSPINTSSAGMSMVPDDEEEPKVNNPMESHINNLNQQIDKAIRLFQNKISFFNAYLEESAEQVVLPVEGSVEINGDTFTIRDLIKKVIT